MCAYKLYAPCVCPLSLIRCACSLFFLFYWANDCVSKNKGDDTTTRTEIETAGSGKIWVRVSSLLAPRSRPLQKMTISSIVGFLIPGTRGGSCSLTHTANPVLYRGYIACVFCIFFTKVHTSYPAPSGCSGTARISLIIPNSVLRSRTARTPGPAQLRRAAEPTPLWRGLPPPGSLAAAGPAESQLCFDVVL